MSLFTPKSSLPLCEKFFWMESSNPLLRRYRSDRRKLLEFLLSSGLVKEIITPAGPTTSFSNIEFDFLSADYVIECIQSGMCVCVMWIYRSIIWAKKWAPARSSYFCELIFV